MVILNKVAKTDSAFRRRFIMKKIFNIGLLLLIINVTGIGIHADDLDLPDIPGGTDLASDESSADNEFSNDFLIQDDSAADTPSTNDNKSTDDLDLESLTVEDATQVVDEPQDAVAPEAGMQPADPAIADAPIVNDIIIRGGFASASEIQAKMGTRKGRPLDKKILEEDFQRLYKMGKFADVQIKEEVLPDNKVNIIVLLREKNLIRRITFRGNKVKPKKLQKEIESKIDTRYDEGQATRDARSLEEYYNDKFYYFTKVTPEAEPFEDGVRLVFNIDEGHKIWIRDIVFRGNYRFTDQALRKVMQTRQSSFFIRGKLTRKNLEADLERVKLYYQTNGYLDVEVTERPFQVTADSEYDNGWFSHDDMHLYIDINEGEQYRIGAVSFDGNKLVSDDDLRNVIQTMPGKIYSPLTAMEDSTHIRDIYGAAPNSRYFTKIFPERILTEQPNVVDVVFHIQESPQVVIEDVQIVGNDSTKDSVYRRELEFFPGEMIDSRKIEASKNNILNLDYTEADTLDIAVKEGSSPDRARVVVDMEEKQTGNVSFGVGFSSDDPMSGSVTLSQRNFDFQDYPENLKELITGKAFRGAGQYASTSLSMGTKSRNYGLDFFNPWIYNKPVGWGFGFYWKTYEWDDFTQETFGGYTTFSKKILSPNLTASATYRLDNVRMYDFDDDASDVIKQETGSNWLSSLTFALTYDSRDSIFRPSRGIKAVEKYQIYGTFLGGDFSFWRNTTTFQGFYPFYTDKKGRNWVITGRTGLITEGPYNDSRIPTYEMLYAGGIGSVRGWESGTLGPHDDGTALGGYTSQTNSLEMLFPVYEKLIEGSAFFDIGGAFPDTFSIDTGPAGDYYRGCGYRASIGLGVHVVTPLSPMPIRIYFPLTLNDKDGDDTEFIQFSFGATF